LIRFYTGSLFFSLIHSVFFVLDRRCTALMSVSYFNKYTKRVGKALCILLIYLRQTNRLLKSKNWEQHIDFVSLEDRQVSLFSLFYREKIIRFPATEKIPVDFGKSMFVHFTFCAKMKSFPSKFYTLWNKYFTESPIDEIKPVLGTRNVNNLQQRLVFNRWFYEQYINLFI
jgi:hypothetical protein